MTAAGSLQTGKKWTSRSLVRCLLTLLLAAGVHEVSAGIPALHRTKREEILYSSVCEGSTMNLRCRPGQVILLESANFGRTDTETCPRGTIKDTDCWQSTSFDIVSNTCDNRNYCQVRATSGVFGNPCPGTFKYLEVQFQCIQPIETATTPPPVVTTQKPTTPTPVAVTTRVTDPPATTRAASPAATPSPMPTPEPVVTTLPGVVSTQAAAATTLAPEPPKEPTTQPSLATTRAATETNVMEFCPAVSRRGIEWPRTRTGSLSTQACPEGTTGGMNARWHCEGRPAVWLPETGPDLSLCTSAWVEEIENQSDGSVVEISEVMANVVEENEEIYGGDLLVVTTLMQDSIDTLREELAGQDQEERFETAKTVTMNYVKIGSSVLSDSKLESWQDLPGTEKTLTATSLLTSIEESGFLLADNLGSQETLTSELGNVVLEVVVQNTSKTDFREVTFPQPSQLKSVEWKGVSDSITLPKASLVARSQGGQSKVVFLAYNNLGQLLEGSRWLAADPAAAFVVNSRILSASLDERHRPASLPEPVRLVFQHSQDNLSDPVCSYWRFNSTTLGEWSDKGCSLVSTNESHTVCSCDHLTNFAILMNTKGVAVPREHHFALSVITYAGFIISSICLFLAFVTFAYFKNLQNDRNTIHKNLCICLLLAEIIFMAGIDQASKGAMCTVVALFLHYFFLAAFAWMCLEGIQLYVMLVEVFEAESSRRKYYYPFGYGVPLFVVGVSAAIDISSYGTDEYCWLAVENNFIWAFVAPVIVVIIVNTMFLSMAIFIMCRHSTMQTNQREKTNKEKITMHEQNLSSKTHNQEDPPTPSSPDANMRSWVRGALVLLCLLGITWAFGLLYVAESLLVFAYIFTVANVFQGVFIFVFHCFMNEKVVKEYHRYIRKSTWMPQFIRERYATTFTGSHHQRSSSSSSGKRRIWSQEEKRLSNTTGSCSVDNRKLSTSSNGRNSGEFVPVRFKATIPDHKAVNQRLSDEGISLEMEDGHPESAQTQAQPQPAQPRTPSPPPRRSHPGRGKPPSSPSEDRPLLLASPAEKQAPKQTLPPVFDGQRRSPPAYRRPKSGNFTSLPDLARPDAAEPPAGRHAQATKKGSLPELARSPQVLRARLARMNSDSQRVGHWSPLDEERPPTVETQVAEDNSGDVELLAVTNLSPRRETLI